MKVEKFLKTSFQFALFIKEILLMSSLSFFFFSKIQVFRPTWFMNLSHN